MRKMLLSFPSPRWSEWVYEPNPPLGLTFLTCECYARKASEDNGSNCWTIRLKQIYSGKILSDRHVPTEQADHWDTSWPPYTFLGVRLIKAHFLFDRALESSSSHHPHPPIINMHKQLYFWQGDLTNCCLHLHLPLLYGSRHKINSNRCQWLKGGRQSAK